MPSQEHWHSPANLSDQDLLRMQQDARQRVRRMQQQANEAMRRGGVPREVEMTSSRPAPVRHASEPTQSPPKPRASSGTASALTPVLELLRDEDRMLILLLLILLGSERSDPALLLALVYLLL